MSSMTYPRMSRTAVSIRFTGLHKSVLYSVGKDYSSCQKWKAGITGGRLGDCLPLVNSSSPDRRTLASLSFCDCFITQKLLSSLPSLLIVFSSNYKDNMLLKNLENTKDKEFLSYL